MKALSVHGGCAVSKRTSCWRLHLTMPATCLYQEGGVPLPPADPPPWNLASQPFPPRSPGRYRSHAGAHSNPTAAFCTSYLGNCVCVRTWHLACWPSCPVRGLAARAPGRLMLMLMLRLRTYPPPTHPDRLTRPPRSCPPLWKDSLKD